MPDLTATQLSLVLAGFGVVASLAIAYIFHVISQRDAKPLYTVSGNVVVAPRSERVRVTFDDRPVHRVNRSLVYIWNDGRSPVRSEDVRQPITIALASEGSILEARILSTTRQEVEARCRTESRDEVVLTFSHLDHRDGVCIEVVHTSTLVYDMTVSGVIVGVKGGLKHFPTPLWDDPLGPWIYYAGGLFVLGLSVWFAITIDAWPPLLVGLSAMAGSVKTARASKRRDVRYLPDGLRDPRPPVVPRYGWSTKAT